jgi:hypothetical protein
MTPTVTEATAERVTEVASTAGTLRKDLSIISSLLLLGLVALSALTGLVMDEAPEVIPVDDAHVLIGVLMAGVAAFHALLNLRPLHKYTLRRLGGVMSAARGPRDHPESTKR